jgi:hypothetical protein
MAKVELPERKSPAKRPPRRWKLRAALLVLVVVSLAPSVVSLTGHTRTILEKLNPQLAAAVQFRSTELHWWSAIELRDVTVADLSETTHVDSDVTAANLFEAARIRTHEPLWQVVLQRGRDLTVSLESPVLHLSADSTGNNVQRTLEILFGPDDSSAKEPFPIRVQVTDGTVNLDAGPLNPNTETAVAIHDVRADVSTLHMNHGLPAVDLSARIDIQHGDQQQHDHSAVVQSNPDRDVRVAGGGTRLQLDRHGLPLPQPTGLASHEIRIHVAHADSDDQHKIIQLAANDLNLEWLQPVLNSLAGDVTCRGVVSGSLVATLAGSRISDGLAGRLQLRGQDVAVRQSTWAADEWVILGNTRASGTVVWASDGILLDDVAVDSDVVQLSGGGELRFDEPGQIRYSVDSDNRSVADAPAGTVRLSGQLDGAKLLRMLNTTLAVHDDLELREGVIEFGLRAVQSDARSSSEESGLSSSVRWQAFLSAGRIDAVRAGQPVVWNQETRLEAVGVLVNASPHVSQVRFSTGGGQVDVLPVDRGYRVTGRLDPNQLWQQIGQLVQIEKPGLNSEIELDAILQLAGDRFTIHDGLIACRELTVRSERLRIDPNRPLTEMFDGTVHVDGRAPALKTVIAPWYSAPWLSDSSRVELHMTAAQENGFQLLAEIKPDQLSAGSGRRVLSVGRTQPATVRNASSGITVPPRLLIDQARVALELKSNRGMDQFEIVGGQIELPGLTALPTGSINLSQGEPEVDLAIETQFDLDVLTHRLMPANSGIRFFGRGRDTFRVTGSPSRVQGTRLVAADSTRADGGVRALHVTGGISWERGELFGLTVDASGIQGTLENGVFRTRPISCFVNGGELNVMPQYDLARQRLQLAPGSRISNLQLTPQLCRDWVGFAIPLLANSTTVRGTVSARIEEFDYDFQQPERSVVSGVVSIHQAEAVPESGLRTLLQALDVIRRSGNQSSNYASRSLTMPEQDLAVTLQNGVVSHSGLAFDLADYRIRSSGQVGLDRSMRLVLDIPLEKMRGSSEYRSVQVPVGGTLDRWQPDTRRLLQNLGAREIESQLNKQIDQQFDKLFDKLR